MILATENTTEVLSNDIVTEMAGQLRTGQQMIAQAIDSEMSKQVTNEDLSAIMFRVNDNITTVLGAVDGLREGTLSHVDATSILAPLRSANNDSITDSGERASAKEEESAETGSDRSVGF